MNHDKRFSFLLTMPFPLLRHSNTPYLELPRIAREAFRRAYNKLKMGEENRV